MPIIRWSDKLSVGIREFDEEHQQLLALLNDLFDAAVGGFAKDALERTLDGLVEYTKTHFVHEERHMLLRAYPAYSAHKAQHDAFTADVLAVQARCGQDTSIGLSMDVLRFLERWLVAHIQGSDAKYGAFLRSQQPR